MMSEDALRAARIMRQAADDNMQAARNMEGTLEQFRMLWERDIRPTLVELMGSVRTPD